MSWEKISPKGDEFLGRKLELARKKLGLTRVQFGKQVRETYQQIEKYETGYDRVPIAKLEKIAAALDCKIPKKIIRRISFLRKIETETGQEQEALIGFYEEAFEE